MEKFDLIEHLTNFSRQIIGILHIYVYVFEYPTNFNLVTEKIMGSKNTFRNDMTKLSNICNVQI